MATKKSAVKDLTNGSPVKLILGFALPLLLGMLFLARWFSGIFALEPWHIIVFSLLIASSTTAYADHNLPFHFLLFGTRALTAFFTVYIILTLWLKPYSTYLAFSFL